MPDIQLPSAACSRCEVGSNEPRCFVCHRVYDSPGDILRGSGYRYDDLPERRPTMPMPREIDGIPSRPVAVVMPALMHGWGTHH